MRVACVQAVVPLASEEAIDASVIKEGVVPRATVLEIAPWAAEHRVAPGAAEDRIATAEPSHDVIAASSSDFIVTGSSEKGLARGAAKDKRRPAQNDMSAGGIFEWKDGNRISRAGGRAGNRHPA